MENDIDYNATKKEYEINEKFKEVVNAYAEGRRISVNAALEHKVVHSICKDYKERRKNL